MVWTPEQAGQFLDFLADTEERLYGLYHVITFRGLRRGEACGLRKTDRNRTQKALPIATQLVLDGREVIEHAPKTDSGERIVVLDDYTDEVLDEQELRQEAERLEWGEAWTNSGGMFTVPDGSPVHPGWLTDHFERLVELSGLPPIRLHDLRHVAASLMLAAGVDVKTVSETLGHSDTRITRDIYQSVMPRSRPRGCRGNRCHRPQGRRPPAEARSGRGGAVGTGRGPAAATRFGRGHHHRTRWPHFGLTRGREEDHRVPVPHGARIKKAQVSG